MDLIEDTFKTKKPIIAMCHLRALPGDPYYNTVGGIRLIVDSARRELLDLQEGGVDAVMFSNEFSLPYLKKVDPVTTSSMAYVIGQIRNEIHIPFGVNVLWDPIASLDLAAATDASFIREIMSGVYASDFGLWDTDMGKIARHKTGLNLNNLKMLYNIVPESANYLVQRDISEIAKTTVFNARPDVICVSGPHAGDAADESTLQKVKKALPDTAVFVNTGCKAETIAHFLDIADGAVVGTTFKENGIFENPVDLERVKRFMDKVHEFRKD